MADNSVCLRVATPDDASGVARIIDKAYGGYVEEMGCVPAPMQLDYGSLIAEGKVTVATLGDRVAGVLVAYSRRDGFHVENIAVDPNEQGHGVGQVLMSFAETMAQRAGRDRIDLYTNAVMRSNVPFYEKLGYIKVGRAVQDGYDRIFFSKVVAGA